MKRLLIGGVLAVASVLALSGVGGAATPASAVTKRDTASTKVFIALQEQRDIDAIRSAPAANAAEHVFAAQIGARCPGVLKHLPKKLSDRQGEAMALFVSEAVLALGIDA